MPEEDSLWTLAVCWNLTDPGCLVDPGYQDLNSSSGLIPQAQRLIPVHLLQSSTRLCHSETPHDVLQILQRSVEETIQYGTAQHQLILKCPFLDTQVSLAPTHVCR